MSEEKLTTMDEPSAPPEPPMDPDFALDPVMDLANDVDVPDVSEPGDEDGSEYDSPSNEEEQYNYEDEDNGNDIEEAEDDAVIKKSMSPFDMMIYAGIGIMAVIGTGVGYVMLTGSDEVQKTPQVQQSVQAEVSMEPDYVEAEEESFESAVAFDEPEPLMAETASFGDDEFETPAFDEPTSEMEFDSEVSNQAMDDMTARIEIAEAKINKMASILIEAGGKITMLESEIDEANSLIAHLEAEQTAAKVEAKAIIIKQATKAKKVAKAKKTASVNKVSTKKISGYTIQSMVNNKVWLLYKGKKHVLGLGDKVPSAGRIVAIDIDKKQVITSAGIIK